MHYSSTLGNDWFDCNKVMVHNFCGETSGSEVLKRARSGSSKQIDTWDYQVNAVAASCLQYTIHPSIALIQNIGFGQDATHTSGNLTPDYFYESTELSREEWILSVRISLENPNFLPPFIRKVSDLAYAKSTLIKRFKNFCKKLFKYSMAKVFA